MCIQINPHKIKNTASAAAIAVAMLHRQLAPAPAPLHQPTIVRPKQQSTSPIAAATSSFPGSPLSSTTYSHASSSPPPSKIPVDFSPPLIAMVVIIVTAFVIITFSRHLSRQFLYNYRRYTRWRRRRRVYVPSSSAGDVESQPYSFDHNDALLVPSPYGLDDSIIKTIPLSAYIRKGGFHDCAVCLIEFEENDYIRTLPVCSHAFHVDCIDIWLRSHPNCPLCRAGICRQESPFTPLMAARIRPSLDEMLFTSTILEPLAETPIETEVVGDGEITQEPSPRRRSQSEDRFNSRDFLLKRSYSFGFERNIESDRLVLEPATASPWRYRRALGVGGGFWSKRPSPFTALTKHSVFSSRYYRGIKSPFSRRRSVGNFLPLSESSFRTCLSSGGGGCSSRRSKSFASPLFMHRSSGGTTLFSPSRLRSGDPEALVSPERLGRR